MTLEDIALQMTSGLGPIGAAHLVEQFGDARNIFAATKTDLVGTAELSPHLAERIINRQGFSDAKKELDFCRRNGIRPVASTDPEYPALLREISAPPHVIYTQGDVSVLSRRCLSVVGTRKPSPYGITQCTRLIERLAERVPELCIVSGLAFGIDAAAHHAALSLGIPTAAILPNTLSKITPAQHTNLARDIVEKGGVLVSEVPSRHPLHGTGYLARNRIIAGLSAGCLVVEAPRDSGSLSTAIFAQEYNRHPMALPGRLSDATSQGTNRLIRDNKAQLVLSAENIIYDLKWDLEPDATVPRPQAAAPDLSEDEQALLARFPESDPLSIDELIEASGLCFSTLQAQLMQLEIGGAIQSLPGNRYLKIR